MGTEGKPQIQYKKRTSAAKAVVGRPFYGTAKPVPFVQRRFFPQLFSRCPRSSDFYRISHSQD
jgi:hypothetical protein